jgi:hypothetical protein
MHYDKTLERPNEVRTAGRERMARRIRTLLEKRGYPRIQMFFLIAAAGGSAFVASFALLHAGITAMWMRYPLALSVAYAIFLAMLWLWMKTRPEHYDNAPDLAEALPTRSASEAGAAASEAGSGTASAGEFAASALSGELALPLGILLLGLELLFSSLYVVYSAPLLFSEILADALHSTAGCGGCRRATGSKRPSVTPSGPMS